jgi:putative ATPase
LLSALEAVTDATSPDSDSVRRPKAPWIAEICERPLPPAVGREEHFDLISALIKSMRGSDPHASLYWLARLLEGGEDPLFLARRLIIFASEDVGLAEPAGLHHATAAANAIATVGLPEGRLALAQATLYLALSPKSNRVDLAYRKAASLARENGPLAVPMRIRNAPTNLMKRLGYGDGYRSPHEESSHWIPESYLPDAIPPEQSRIVEPGEQGREREIWAGHRRRTGGFYEQDPPDGRRPR